VRPSSSPCPATAPLSTSACGTGLALHHLQGPGSVVLAASRRRFLQSRCAPWRSRRLAGIDSIELREGRFEETPLGGRLGRLPLQPLGIPLVERRPARRERDPACAHEDGEMDLWFTGLNTGREFARSAAEILPKYVDLENTLECAAVMASLDRNLVHDIFSSFESSGSRLRKR